MFDFDENLENEFQESINKFEMSQVTGELAYFSSEEFESLIDYFLTMDEVEKAIEAIKMAQKIYPFDTFFFCRRAEIYIEQNNPNKALDVVNKGMLINPFDGDLVSLKGKILLELNRFKEAKETFIKAIDFCEDKASIYIDLIDLAVKTEDWQIIAHYLDKVLDEALANPTLLYDLKFQLENKDTFEYAKSFYNAYLDQDPYSSVAWFQLGCLYEINEDYVNALKALEYSTLTDDFHAEAFFHRGICYKELNNFFEALEMFEKVVEIEGDDPYALYEIGNCYLELDLIDQAQKYFKEIVKTYPFMGEAWYGMGLSYVQDSQSKKAIFYLEKAVDLETENVEYTMELALAYAETEQFAKAEKIYEDILKNDDAPFEEYYIDKSWLYLFQQKHSIALDVIEEGLSFFPEEGNLLFRKVIIQFLLGRKKEALNAFQKAMLIAPDDLDIIYLEAPYIIDDSDFQKILNNLD